MFWLGEEVLDSAVLDAVKEVPKSGCRPIVAMTVHLLHRGDLVRSCQFMPNDEDVYLSLLRLLKKRKVARYVDRESKGIRYKLP